MKFFFITDKIEQEEIKMEHMPTKRTPIDVNTKTKQGWPFRVDRGMILNFPTDLSISLAFEAM